MVPENTGSGSAFANFVRSIQVETTIPILKYTVIDRATQNTASAITHLASSMLISKFSSYIAAKFDRWRAYWSTPKTIRISVKIFIEAYFSIGTS